MTVAAATAPLGILAFGAGVTLVWSAITGQNPLEEVRKLLRTGTVDGRPADASIRVTAVEGGASVGAGVAGDVGRAAGAAGAAVARAAAAGNGPPAALVSIGQGSHRLAPAAATAFRAAEQRFGRTIPVTDTVRDYNTQLRQWQANPRRFGNPDTSAHVQGLAVDVNLGAVGARPQGSTPSGWLNDPAYRRLFDAMTGAGWCNWQMNRGNTGGKIPEPWHFSYGGCS